MDAKGLLPVYLYIHGGGFMSWSGNFDGKYLLDEGIVMVSFNYRLGPLGFLTFNTGSSHDVPGNLGLKDQQLAMRWVQKNIQYFRGDPNQVTIGGFSSGASSVQYHVLTPTSAGLFRGAIARGGSALSFWSSQRQPRKNANAMAKLVGCPTLNETNANIKEVVQCLQERPAQQLTEFQLKLREWHEFPYMPFSVTIEHPSNKEALITEHPRKILEEGRFKPVPLLLTMNREEVNLMAFPIMANKERLDYLFQNWDAVAPILYDYRHLSLQDKTEVSQLLKQIYFPHWKEQGSFTNDSIIRLMQDRFFFEPLDTSVRLHSRRGPVYSLILCHRSDFSFIHTLFKAAGYYGLVHGDELQYLFPGGFAGAPDYNKGTPAPYRGEFEFSQNFVKILGGFIRDLKPSLWDGNVWEPVRQDLPVEYIAFDNQIEKYEEPDQIRRLDLYRKALQKADT